MKRGRGSILLRQWNLLLMLRRGPKTVIELADALGVCERTIVRDLEVLQGVPFPLTAEQERVWKHAKWTLSGMPEWPRNSVAPVQELRA